MQEIIAIGEIWAGLAYIFAGIGFLVLSELTRAGRSLVKIVAGGLFIVAGIEEIGDALFIEGASTTAYVIQIFCTALQVAFNSLACWVLYQANRWQWIK